MLRVIASVSQSPEEALAEDMRLFHSVETAATDETIRLWESPVFAVVLGHGSRPERDVHADSCRADGVALLRRTSGGGAVVVGPGCLNFSLVLDLDRRPELAHVARSYDVILESMLRALDVAGLSHRGLSDLALGDRKVSGNAQRRGRRALLHHGTLLYDFDAARIARYLREPERPPSYRARRPHEAFVTNLPLTRAETEDRIRLVAL